MKEPAASSPERVERRRFLGASATVLGAVLAGGCRSVRPRDTEYLHGALEDPQIRLDRVTIHSATSMFEAIQARPRAGGAVPGIVVIPGNWLIEPYIAEFVAQLAQAGFAALAIDIFHQFPKVATWEEAQAVSPDTTQGILRSTWTDEQMLADVLASVRYLSEQSFVAGEKVVVSGFCGGGWNSILFAADHPELVSCVVAYYAPPDLAQHFGRPRSVLSVLPAIRVPLQTHFGTRDGNIPLDQVDRLRETATSLTTPFELHLYDADHGFMAFNRAQRFDAASASLAFERTIGFLDRYAARS
jgi:carboxymethylenebutenolidase